MPDGFIYIHYLLSRLRSRQIFSNDRVRTQIRSKSSFVFPALFTFTSLCDHNQNRNWRYRPSQNCHAPRQQSVFSHSLLLLLLRGFFVFKFVNAMLQVNQACRLKHETLSEILRQHVVDCVLQLVELQSDNHIQLVQLLLLLKLFRGKEFQIINTPMKRKQ